MNGFIFSGIILVVLLMLAVKERGFARYVYLALSACLVITMVAGEKLEVMTIVLLSAIVIPKILDFLLIVMAYLIVRVESSKIDKAVDRFNARTRERFQQPPPE